MNVTVFGAGGLLGSHIVALLRVIDDGDAFDVTAHTREEFDFRQRSTLESAIVADTHVVINAAAMTDAAACETRNGQIDAVRVNELAPAEIARACRVRGVRFIHMSCACTLEDSTTPAPDNAMLRHIAPTVLAKTKREAELRVLHESQGKATIVRTRDVYGHGGRNAASLFARRLAKGEVVEADAEQLVQPTSALEVARTVVELLGDVAVHHVSGPVHVACSGVTTWHDWAAELCALNESPGRVVASVEHEQHNGPLLDCSVLCPAASVTDALREYVEGAAVLRA